MLKGGIKGEMTKHRSHKPTICFDFNEANIINETGHRSADRASFERHLVILAEHTSDPYLVSCVNELMHKLEPLSDADFQQLLEDAKAGNVLFPPNYSLPKTSEISL